MNTFLLRVLFEVYKLYIIITLYSYVVFSSVPFYLLGSLKKYSILVLRT